MSQNDLCIDTKLVERLISKQFPEYQALTVTPIKPGGWDNRSFRLGDELIVRLPSDPAYAAQVIKEQQWLPKLRSHLVGIDIPIPVAQGEPSIDYPFHWSIYQWLEGITLESQLNVDKVIIAKQLANFLNHLQKIKLSGGPESGQHNFYRGAHLSEYNDQFIQAIHRLNEQLDVKKAKSIWQSAIATRWANSPVWVHGDVSPGNLLVDNQQITAVIDFGCLAMGDPACDLMMAWNYFDESSRIIFKNTLELDENTWLRGSAWALWKSVIVLSGLVPAPSAQTEEAKKVLKALDC